MRKSLILIPFFLILIFSGCADSVSDLNTKDVVVSVEIENLNARNNFNHSVYYFVVEAGVAAVIQWAAISTDENRIKSRSTKQIPFNEIHAFEPGDEIIIYYWSKKEPGNNNIKSQRIETN